MGSSAPSLVPAWLMGSAAVGWRVLAIAGLAIVVGIVASSIPVSVTAVLVSLVLAGALAPTALRLRARGSSRAVAAALAFASGAVLIAGAAALLLVAVAPDVPEVIAAVEQGIDDVREQLAFLGAPEVVAQLFDGIAESLRASIRPNLPELAGTLVDVGTVLVLGTFLTYFLLADGDRGWAWLVRSLAPWQQEAVTASARHGLERVAWYVRRTALLAALDAAVVFVVLSLFGVPLAGALAGVAFMAGFVPYLGAIAGGLTIALATLAIGGPVAALAVLVALVVAWLVATRLLEGTAMNRRVDVHPVPVLIAIPAGLALFGLLGLVALLPVTVFGLAVARSVIAALDLAPGGVLDAGPADNRAPVAETVPGGLPRAPGGVGGVPVWLDRLAQWSWRALVLAGLGGVVIAVVVRIPSVVVPGVIAVVAAATLLPLVTRLGARGWGRGLAAAAATAGAVLAIGLICLAAVLMTLGPLRAVLDAAVAGASQLDLLWLRDLVREAASSLEVDVAAAFAGMVGLGLALLLSLLMTYFFLRDGAGWWSGAMARLPAGRRGPVAEAGGRAVDVLAGYMVGTAIISGFGAITTGLILVVLGLPLAIPIAIIGFFFGFIPYVGSFLSTALALLVTVALGTTSDVVVMLIFTVVFNIAQGNFVTPLVYGRSLSLHPAVVLMAIPVGGEVAGVLGMFLVVPAAAMVAATWRLLLQAIGGPPASAPATEPVAPENGPEASGPEPSHVPAPATDPVVPART